ncbi:MAG: acyl-ACP--UDP-N-acetylglucosamine O-acyltransferase [Legionellales bacterium]|jgi:UDP-N-acetylglucosamine acyltransferase
MIDSQARIHPNAKIAPDAHIGPWTIIGEHVEIGSGTWIGSHVVIEGPTKIGANNKIFQFASIGGEPQDKKYQGEQTSLEIGDHNVIREYCTLNRGTVQGGKVTQIGNHNLLMANVHVAHDCKLGDHIVIANNSAMGGHVTVNDRAILSGFVAIHQFCTIGEFSFISGGSLVTKDILPYVLVAPGERRATVIGVNSEGLKRHGFTSEEITQVQRAYKIIYRKGLPLKEAVAQLQEMVKEAPRVQLMLDFIQQPGRGIVG